MSAVPLVPPASAAPAQSHAAWRWAAPVGLGIFALLLNLPGALSPTLFGDDWFQMVRHPVQGELACPDRLGIFFRPLQPCLGVAQYALFGLNIPVYHLIKLALTGLIPVFLYLLLVEAFPSRRRIAFFATALFISMPTSYVQNWALLGAVDLAFILLLAGMTVAIRSVRRGSLPLLFIAVALFVVTLMTYELFLGLLGLFSLLLLLSAWRYGRLRLWAAAPLVLSVAYAAGRFASELSMASNPYGYPTTERAMGLLPLSSRVARGYQLILETSWADAVDRIGLMFFGRPLSSHASLTVVLLFALVLVVACGSGWLTERLRPTLPASMGGRNLSGSVVAIGLGLVAIGAGYFPLIFATFPTMDWDVTHHNSPSSIGLALLLAAVLDLGASRVTRTRPGAIIGLVGGSSVLVLVGAMSLLIVQSDMQRAWLEQKSIWQQLFRLAPDLAADTTVVLSLPPRIDEGTPLPFESGPVSISQALGVLYGHEDLHGTFFYGQDGPAKFTGEGVLPAAGKPIAPYSKVLLFELEPATGVLRQVTDLSGPAYSSAAPRGQALCNGCILANAPAPVALRYLVQ